jgi:hypothetical protein
MSPMPDDTSNRWFDALTEYGERFPDAAIIACDLLYPEPMADGRFAVQSAGGVFRDGAIEYVHSSDLPYDQRFRFPRKVAWATFGGILLKRRAIQACGEIDERYSWAYVMDVDYSLEVRKRGFAIYQVPVALLHDANGTTKRYLDDESYRQKVAGNHLLFYSKWENSPLLTMNHEFAASDILYANAIEAGAIKLRVADLEARNSELQSSWSWKLTAPLRVCDQALKGCLEHLWGQSMEIKIMNKPTANDNHRASPSDWRIRQLESELTSLKGSLSWRVTRPLRFLRDTVEHAARLFRNTLEHAVRAIWQNAVVPSRRRAALKGPPGSFLPPPAAGTTFDYRNLSYPQGGTRPGNPVRLTSMLCERAYLESPAGRYWATAIDQPWRLHRKLWEFCFVSQALHERGVLGQGRRGLGFAVGEEPLPALFASMGCEILATDLDAQDERATAWAETAQLATSVDKLRRPRICPDDIFRQRVAFRTADMNDIPQDLRDFDFTWSSCSFEHCGSIDLGIAFICNQMACLRPGGVAVHTTEFNLSSDNETISSGGTVIFRKRDIDEIVHRLQQVGHRVAPVVYSLGSSDEDRHVDTFPYADAPHLKLLLADRFVSTSIALIIEKTKEAL